MATLQASDILALAMQLEVQGKSFYQAAARKASVSGVRTLFQELARQEEAHYAGFARLADQVREQPMMTDEEWDEYLAYVRGTLISAFFEGRDKALAAADVASGEKDAIRMAIGFEKETLLFFYDLRDRVPATDRPYVDAVIVEEKAHLRRLADALSAQQ